MPEAQNFLIPPRKYENSVLGSSCYGLQLVAIFTTYLTECYSQQGKVQNIGGRGAILIAGCKLIVAPAPNQCQIITFLTLKTDNIAKLRIELKSILLEIPSNKMKGT